MPYVSGGGRLISDGLVDFLIKIIYIISGSQTVVLISVACAIIFFIILKLFGRRKRLS